MTQAIRTWPEAADRMPAMADPCIDTDGARGGLGAAAFVILAVPAGIGAWIGLFSLLF